MTYDEWEQQVPREIKADSVWRIKAYRLGLFLSDLARLDAKPLWNRRDTTEIADQLRQFEGADGFVGPCEMLVAAGRRPA